MPPVKLRLPQTVRVAIRQARQPDAGQKQVAQKLALKSASSIGHYETGERPISKVRFRQLVASVGLPPAYATSGWRLAIQAQIGELLADGGMSARDSDHILTTIERFWSRTEDEGDPRQARPA